MSLVSYKIKQFHKKTQPTPKKGEVLRLESVQYIAKLYDFSIIYNNHDKILSIKYNNSQFVIEVADIFTYKHLLMEKSSILKFLKADPLFQNNSLLKMEIIYKNLHPKIKKTSKSPIKRSIKRN